MGRLPILHVWLVPYCISTDCFLVEMGETIQTPWISSSVGMPLQLSYRDDFCLKFEICECNIDSLGEGTALCTNREVVGQTSLFNGSQRKLDSWAFLRTPDAVMHLSTYWVNQCHMVFLSHVPLKSEENMHSLFTGQKMTLIFNWSRTVWAWDFHVSCGPAGITLVSHGERYLTEDGECADIRQLHV